VKRERRREPRGAYAEGAKQRYGREKWSTVDRYCAMLGMPAHKRRVLYLETRHGNETERLLKRGYDPANLHAVNWVPAELAVLNAKLRKSSGVVVNSHGVPLERAIRETEGQIDVYDCDLTTTADRARDTLHLVARHGLATRVVTATAQCGRESDAHVRSVFKSMGRKGTKPWQVTQLGKQGQFHATMSMNDMARIGMLTMSMSNTSDAPDEPCGGHIEKMRAGKYVSSSGHGMLWVVSLIAPHNEERLEQAAVISSSEFLGVTLPIGLAMAIVHGTLGARTPWCIGKQVMLHATSDDISMGHQIAQKILKDETFSFDERRVVEAYVKRGASAALALRGSQLIQRPTTHAYH
jgi:hypothetical protein